MADITGSLTVEHGGRSYSLRLTMRGLASLQAEFGNSLGGMLDGEANAIPNFALLLRIVEVALGNVDDKEQVADALLSDDVTIVERIMAASFPALVDGASGNGKRATRAKA
jgi:hypothetical protein